MSAQHTPGPWLIAYADEWKIDGRHAQWGRFDISASSTDERDDIYYRIGSVSNVNDSAQNLANAQLIAAAPELLAALQSLMALQEDAERRIEAATEEDCLAVLVQVDAEMRALHEQARAAIAAATGSAP